MKNKSTLITLILILSTIKLSFSQRLEDKTFTLFHYKIEYTETFKKQTAILKSEMLNRDKFEEIFTHITYANIKDKLESEKDIFILPQNSFQDKIKYNEYGYPEIIIQKAIKKSDAKYFIKINVIYSSNEYTANKDDSTIEPKVTIEIQFFNDLGYVPIKKFKASAISDKPIKLSNEFFYGYNRKIKKSVEKTITLIDILNKAINDIITQI